MVDAGTVELVRSLGVEVVSSAELIQAFEARWTPAALGIAPGSRPPRGPRARRSLRADPRAHAQRRAAPGSGSEELHSRGLRQGRPGHRSRPHRGRERQRLQPALRADRGSQLRRSAPAIGCCSICGPSSTSPAPVYYDITWTGFCGDNPPEEMRNVFERGDGRARCRHPARAGAPWLPASRCAASRWTTPPRGDHRQPRLRRVFHPPHRPFHRRGSARQRRQHGQPGNPRRAPRDSVDLFFDRARRLSAGIRRALARSICSWASARPG